MAKVMPCTDPKIKFVTKTAMVITLINKEKTQNINLNERKTNKNNRDNVTDDRTVINLISLDNQVFLIKL